MSQLPGGTVTFVFTDIEGSTKLLQELGDEAYGQVSSDHRRLVRETFGARGGTEIDTQGDAFFFSSRARATRSPRRRRAARAARPRVAGGTRGARADGPPHGRAAHGRGGLPRRSTSSARPDLGAGHGGQILISETTRALLGNQLPEGVAVHDLGQQDLKDVQHEHIYELTIDGAPPCRSKPLQARRASRARNARRP